MKMNQNHNLFSFLSRGVTTTHPWCSVFILLICFVFCADYISVSASQSNIPTMTDWQFAQAIDAYAGLTDDQKEIANFLVGSQGYAFAGIAQSNLNSNFSSYSETIEYVKNYGAKMWDQFNTHVDGVVQNGRNNLLAVKNDLSNFFGNAVSYAKSRSESFSAWLGNVGIDYNSSSEFRIQFGKDQAQNNNDFFGDEGLYNWQYSSTVITPSDFQFNWNSAVPSASVQQQYYSGLTYLSQPHIKFNFITGPSNPPYYNGILASVTLSSYHNLFVDLSNNTVYLCNDSGATTSSLISLDYVSVFNSQYTGWNYQGGTNRLYLNTLNFLNYGNLKALFTALSNNPKLLYSFFSGDQWDLCLSDWIENLYIGYSWSDKAPWTSDFDLNLTSTSQYVTINAPVNTIYIDLNGFMRDLYDNPTIIYNYVINNSIDGNGDPVDPSGFEPVSKFPGIPDSGITIGTEFFKINGLNPLFGSDGYISALWNNTKGLVLYIGDILKVLTLDSIDGGGFAWVIYGAISMGVIGGIFSKFLL